MKDELIQVEHTEKGGIGWFFFALIPGAIAGGALMWLAFYTGVIDWTKTQRIEGRMDARVGVNGELKTPVDLVARNTGCLKIARSFLDSGQLTLYVKSACSDRRQSFQWTRAWKEIAPDGTVVQQGREYGTAIEPGETIELHEDLKDDPRTVRVVVAIGQ